MYTLVATSFAIIYVVYLFTRLWKFAQRDKRLPPGPPTIPVLGNALSLMNGKLHVKFEEWAQKYGPVVSLKVGASTIVVLNSRQAVNELIDKRSAIYSDRPIDQNNDDLFHGENFVLMDAVPRWRSQRKAATQMMTPKILDEKFAPVIDAEISQLVYDLLTDPKDFYAHVQRVTASATAIVIFGIRGASKDSFWARCVYDGVKIIDHAMDPAGHLPVDQFPLLKYIPHSLVPSKARAKQVRKEHLAIWNEAVRRVKARRAEGDSRDSILDNLLGGELDVDLQDSPTALIAYASAVHEAAADTTSTMMLTAILHLAKYPWVQEKARKELDRVCKDRMPTWDDFENLPYINCIVKEGLRFRTVVLTGIPHRVRQDDWYDGHLIPKDATIFIPPTVLNFTWSGADEYNPDRYLGHPKLAPDYASSPDYENRDHYSYGAGRRICPGMHLAERVQWRIVARMLWAFTIEPGLDEAGNPIELDMEYTEYLLAVPVPFKVRFVPRSEFHAKVIKGDFENTKDFLRQWE